MKIAILAWGYLIWNQGDLAAANAFTPDGPQLPIEFSRVSNKDAAPRRLTPVIDETIGVD
jgi:hypothetical protein